MLAKTKKARARFSVVTLTFSSTSLPVYAAKRK